MTNGIDIINGWGIAGEDWWYYFCVILWSLGIRLLLSLLQTIDYRSWEAFGCSFLGYPKKGELENCGDHWQAFALGTVELLAFPVLIKTGHWDFIGAWLVFKTLGHYQQWQKNRRIANRFLIGVALILIISTCALSNLIVPK